MAKPVLPKKAKTIRIWLWIIILLFVGMFFTMKYTIMGKTNIIGNLVENCIQNAPYGPSWEQDLAKNGYKGDTKWVAEPYCKCVLLPVFEPMSETDIRQFSKLDADSRLEKMGGRTGLQQRHEQCLVSVKQQQ